MKYLIVILFFTFEALIFPPSSLAHGHDQRYFFKVYGIYTGIYQVPRTSLTVANIPQDIANQTFSINEPIEFEIDSNNLHLNEFRVYNRALTQEEISLLFNLIP